MRTAIIYATLGLVIACNSNEQQKDQTGQGEKPSKVQGLFDRYAEMKKADSPTQATGLGFKEFDGRWWDLSVQRIEERRTELTSFLSEVNEVEGGSVDAQNAIYLGLMKADIEDDLDRWKNDLHLFGMSEQFGVHQSLPYVISDHSMASKADAEALLKLLSTADRPINDAIANLELAKSKGLTQPITAMKGVPDQIKKIAQMKPEETPFFKPFKELKNFTQAERDGYMDQAKRAIQEVVLPAYQRLLTFIENDYLPACRETVGISAVPDGTAKYAALIKQFTTTDLTAQEIHDVGLMEVKRILAEMEKIKQEVGFKGDLNAFNEHLRTDPKFFYTDKNALIEGYQVICKRVDPELVKLFGTLPRLPYGVVPVPEYLEKYYTTARYSDGSFETMKAGEFLANTYALNTRPKWEMEALSLHEAVPGHHLQIALEKEITDQPEFKKFLGYTVFVEGWGLYSESLGSDLGLYKDPYSRYGQLTYEMWRAIRLVVDTGIHAFGWTREEAITYFKANSAKTENDIAVEVDRYIGWPGQALAYKIGELKIQEIKRTAKERLGEKFDIRAFHDKLLSKGSLPINVLEAMMDEWVTLKLEEA